MLSRLAGVTVLVVALWPAAAVAAPGDVDSSFGAGGTFSPDVGSQSGLVAGDRAPDGSLLVAGTQINDATGPDVLVASVKADGSGLNTAFGGGKGYVTFPLAPEKSPDSVVGVAVAADGSIFVGGQTFVGGSPQLFVAKLDPFGDLLGEFGAGGVRTIDIPGALAEGAGALVLDGMGRPLLSGGDDTDYLVVRLDPKTGAYDTSFDGDGIVRGTGVAGAPDTGTGLAISGDSIYVGGLAGGPTTGAAVVKLDSAGAMDPAYGTGANPGIASFQIGSKSSRLNVLGVDGTTGVVGFGGAGSDVDGGDLQPGFGTLTPEGQVRYVRLTTMPTPPGQIRGLLLDSIGGLIASGSTSTPDGGDFFSLAANADGSPNTAFGDGGTRVYAAEGDLFGGRMVFDIERGRYVLVGDTFTPPSTQRPTLTAVRITDKPPDVGSGGGQEPIIFIHGFLGSKVNCNGKEAWPNIPPVPDFPAMRLTPSGNDDLSGECTLAPGLLETVAGVDVYGSTKAYLDSIAPNRWFPYVYDWRRSPGRALAGLDALVERIRGNGKVVIMAHSMGGLVTRWYIDDPDRAKKVSRAITIGSPYWGAPKSFFPLAAGVDSPNFSALDILFDNDDLHDFARNLEGLYYLWPSRPYGRWLTVDGRRPEPLDRGGLLSLVRDVLRGNRGMLGRALDDHARHLDNLRTNGVDYQVLAGTGLMTIGAVRIVPRLIGGGGVYYVDWANGDGTVPRKSGHLGGSVPSSRMHYSCGVGHVPLPGHPSVTSRITGFLLRGEPVVRGGAGCGATGNEVRSFLLSLGASTARVQPARPSARAMTLAQAERAGVIELLDINGQQVFATNRSDPVRIRLRAKGIGFVVTPLAGGKRGRARYFGPLSGRIVLQAGRRVTVRRAGRRVRPLKRADRRPPRTRATITIRRRRAIVRFRATDNTAVAATYVKIGSRPRRRVRGPVRLAIKRLPSVRVQSVDVFGNVEPPRRFRRR